MLSKDFDAYDNYKVKYLDDKILRYLDGQSMAGEKVGYLTIPRSGNTFLRKYLELVSGVPTGSDV